MQNFHCYMLIVAYYGKVQTLSLFVSWFLCYFFLKVSTIALANSFLHRKIIFYFFFKGKIHATNSFFLGNLIFTKINHYYMRILAYYGKTQTLCKFCNYLFHFLFFFLLKDNTNGTNPFLLRKLHYFDLF